MQAIICLTNDCLHSFFPIFTAANDEKYFNCKYFFLFTAENKSILLYGSTDCWVFKRGVIKLERFLPKNQHTKRKLHSNLAIRNFLVSLKLFLNAKSSLSLWSKWQISHRKWFLNTNLFIIKLFLIAKFDCIKFWELV